MHIAYANVFVSDLDRSVAFFRDVLGLELADGAHGYASFDAGPISLGLAVPGVRRAGELRERLGVPREGLARARRGLQPKSPLLATD